MNKRKQEAVIRFYRYNKETEPSNWYRAKLMLYYPWYDEQRDLLGSYSTYEEHYRHVHDVVQINALCMKSDSGWIDSELF